MGLSAVSAVLGIVIALVGAALLARSRQRARRGLAIALILVGVLVAVTPYAVILAFFD